MKSVPQYLSVTQTFVITLNKQTSLSPTTAMLIGPVTMLMGGVKLTTWCAYEIVWSLGHLANKTWLHCN